MEVGEFKEAMDRGDVGELRNHFRAEFESQPRDVFRIETRRRPQRLQTYPLVYGAVPEALRSPSFLRRFA